MLIKHHMMSTKVIYGTSYYTDCSLRVKCFIVLTSLVIPSSPPYVFRILLASNHNVSIPMTIIILNQSFVLCNLLHMSCITLQKCLNMEALKSTYFLGNIGMKISLSMESLILEIMACVRSFSCLEPGPNVG